MYFSWEVAYGRSGTGKTTALLETGDSPVETFTRAGGTFQCLELQGEQLIDLATGKRLIGADKNIVVDSETWAGIRSLPVEQLKAVQSRRVTAETMYNEKSSRSHLAMRLKTDDRELAILDLAATETLPASANSQRKIESLAIKKSLGAFRTALMAGGSPNLLSRIFHQSFKGAELICLVGTAASEGPNALSTVKDILSSIFK